MDTINTKTEEHSDESLFSRLTNHFILLQSIAFGVYLLYMIFSFMGAKVAQLEELRSLATESDFNKTAVEAYISCREKLISGTRDKCLVLSKEAVFRLV